MYSILFTRATSSCRKTGIINEWEAVSQNKEDIFFFTLWQSVHRTGTQGRLQYSPEGLFSAEFANNIPVTTYEDYRSVCSRCDVAKVT